MRTLRKLNNISLLLGFFGAVVLAPAQTFAVITLQSIAGASRIDQNITTTQTRVMVYAGFAGSCTASGTSATCDSCDGSGKLPCNHNNAYPTLRLAITLDMGRTDLTYDRIKVKLGSVEMTLTVTPVISSNIVNIVIPWSDICNAYTTGNADCSTPIPNQTLSLGYQASGETTPTYYEMIVNSRYVNPADAAVQYFQVCDTSDPNPNQGFCNYKVTPGDGKVYLDSDALTVASAFPATGAGSINYESLVFYYAPATVGTEATVVNSITNQSDMISLAVAANEKPPVADNRIDGLSNDQLYCFVMANRDVTGIISYFAPSTMATANICAMPQEVFGLLDDKKCFIATAAFGSDMAPEVQSFREFRNQFLLTNSLGKDFVHFYYEHSPKYAKIIAQNDALRATARVALWPLLGFAKLSMKLGVLPTLGILLLGLTAGIALIARARRFGKARA